MTNLTFLKDHTCHENFQVFKIPASSGCDTDKTRLIHHRLNKLYDKGLCHKLRQLEGKIRETSSNG